MILQGQYLQRRKMDNTVDLRMRLKDFLERRLIDDVDFIEIRSLSTEQLDAVEDYFGRVVEAVDNNDVVAMFEECQRGEGTNVAGATVELGQRVGLWQ